MGASLRRRRSNQGDVMLRHLVLRRSNCPDGKLASRSAGRITSRKSKCQGQSQKGNNNNIQGYPGTTRSCLTRSHASGPSVLSARESGVHRTACNCRRSPESIISCYYHSLWLRWKRTNTNYHPTTDRARFRSPVNRYGV